MKNEIQNLNLSLKNTLESLNKNKKDFISPNDILPQEENKIKESKNIIKETEEITVKSPKKDKNKKKVNTNKENKLEISRPNEGMCVNFNEEFKIL